MLPLLILVLSVLASQDFVVSFFVELSVMMLERLYLDPGSKEVCMFVLCSSRLVTAVVSMYERTFICSLVGGVWRTS